MLIKFDVRSDHHMSILKCKKVRYEEDWESAFQNSKFSINLGDNKTQRMVIFIYLTAFITIF